ncbi:hypothetical protein BDZ90DRAFT_261969 [Jaminaea rosea]|uniref:Uncharacterized protein n=1 Tax=Jaminaea rosea TaxID=1569628 RepID=A0A316URK7_9BASI|nr:hypothetical protein BDZ90DRAFT_261969 [Jaminaea rosea]PWN25765.1 hypothetical protein BDZ90DRAFT_261969 [Jaminaea rosea]
MSSANTGAPQGTGTTSIGSTRVQASEYICADCAALNEVRPREPIRCRECGHRVLYKQRTKRMLHFEAR